MHRAAYLLLAVEHAPAARDWLSEFAKRITTSVNAEDEKSLNLAFTAQGLKAFGVHESDLTTFPPSFREGMAAPHRTVILGDTDASHPDNWQWGGPQHDAIHAALLIFAKDDETFATVEANERAALSDDGAFRIVHALRPEPLPGRVSAGKFGVEHFGFADGMSQPVIKGSGQEDKLEPAEYERHAIEAGEFVLGYPNGYDKITPVPRLTTSAHGWPAGDPAEFGRNGSYLVVRQLAQDVAGFWNFIDAETKAAHGASDAKSRSWLAAKMVGRWESGAPLVKAPDSDNSDLGTDNSFGYHDEDQQGARCPIASHVRRTNPRDSSRNGDPKRALELANLHRIVRRGRVYGPGLDDPLAGDDGQERGLFFMCLNANIERQFEFIQHTWCNNQKFAGLYDEQDPMVSNPTGGGRFSIPQDPVRRRISGIPSFVTTRGGAYFFLPGVPALRQLAAIGD